MDEALPPLPPPAAKPFSPAGGGVGCQKPLLLGCGLVSLLLGIAAVVFVVKAKDVLAYAMNQLRGEVVAHLPEGVEESERRRVEESFDAALTKIRSGELDPVALQDLQKKLTAAASAAASRRLTQAELDGLLEALETFNRPPGEPSPAVEQGGSPEAQPAGGSAEPARPPAP